MERSLKKEPTVLRKVGEYGPSIVVLLTVAAVLWLGPAAVRNITHARTDAIIRQASNRLASSDNILELINQAHRDIANKVAPSVVYISTERTDPTRRPRLSSGSGWVYDEAGHIVTNAHVIDGADRIEVQLHDGDTRKAEVMGTDLRTDIAVLKIQPGQLHPAEREHEIALEQGDRVFAFGSPFDFRFSMSQGIVSGIGRDTFLPNIHYRNFIQVDAAINPGNSGGPLTNIYGRVVGMNTAIATGRPGSINDGVFSGIGLAIPIDMIESVVDQLIEKREVSRGFVGVTLRNDRNPNQPKFSPRVRAAGFVGEGVEIDVVNAESPAEAAGLRQHDVILAVDGVPVGNMEQLRAIISSRAPGETIKLRVWRVEEGDTPRELTVEVTLTELQPEHIVRPVVIDFLHELGFARLATATRERAEVLNVPFHQGVIIEQVYSNSEIEGAIQPGSIITHVFDDAIRNLDDFYLRFERAFFASSRRVNVTIISPRGQERIVTLRY